MQAQSSLRSAYTPKPVWQYQANSVVTTPPLFVNGSLVNTTYDNFSGGVLSSVDVQTTGTTWSSKFRNSNFSTLIAVDQIVYAGDQTGALYAIDSVTGSALWTQTGYVISGNTLLCVGEKLLFCTSDGVLRALDLQGKQIWTFQPNSGGAYSPVVSGGLVIVVSGNGTMIHAIDVDNGKLVWTYGLGYQTTGPVSPGQGSLY
jgi:outer membrane protein assembly factor BamB